MLAQGLNLERPRKAPEEERMLWSYRIKEVDFGRAIDDIEKHLDEMGHDGWEAFATFPEPTDHTRGRFLMLFKQPRTDRSSTRHQRTEDSA
jgi:hypothetical protein